MVWINLFLLLTGAIAKELPRFLTKHSLENVRFITADGTLAYVVKRPGVLGLVSSFNSYDFLSEASTSGFLMTGSRFKQRLAIEVIPEAHTEINLLKSHKILVVDWGKTQVKEIGRGINSRLHLQDEWISFFEPYEKLITVQNVLTQKKYQIRLSPKTSVFFRPEVEMISPNHLVYTDLSEKGNVALVQYNLQTQKQTVVYKSPQNASRLELCSRKDYLGIGEFPYDGVSRTSQIMRIKLSTTTNMAGYETIYSSSEPDLGSMVCTDDKIYFVKTLGFQKKINHRSTEAAKLDLKTTQVLVVSDLGAVTRLSEMDGRVMVPFRGDYYILEGTFNLSDDKLEKAPKANEELPLEI